MHLAKEDSLDRNPLNIADANIKFMQGFLKNVKEYTIVESTTGDEYRQVISVLEWHQEIAYRHYRNLLHCYNIAEKKT